MKHLYQIPLFPEIWKKKKLFLHFLDNLKKDDVWISNTNSVKHDQTAPGRAVWSWPSLFGQLHLLKYLDLVWYLLSFNFVRVIVWEWWILYDTIACFVLNWPYWCIKLSLQPHPINSGVNWLVILLKGDISYAYLIVINYQVSHSARPGHWAWYLA